MSKNGAPFQVSLSGEVAQEIKYCAQVASSMGIRASYISSLDAIQKRLRYDPSVFGERRFGSKTLKLTCYVGAIRPVAVQFAVHDELRLVFVVKVILMAHSRFRSSIPDQEFYHHPRSSS